jgi:hypothetical protein
VEAVDGEREQGAPGFWFEGGEAIRVFENGIFEGEGTGFVEEDFPDAEETGPEDGAADEDAAAFHAGCGEVIGEGEGDTEGAGAGDHEEGNHDLKGHFRLPGGEQPCGEAGNREDEDDGNIDPEDPVEDGVAGFVFARFAEAAEEGSVPCFEGGEGKGCSSDVEGSGGETSARGGVAGFGFTADGLHADGSFLADELGGHGDYLAGVGVEDGAGLKLAEGQWFSVRGADRIGVECFAEETAAVAFDGGHLEPASGQHEEGEDGDEIEVEK